MSGDNHFCAGGRKHTTRSIAKYVELFRLSAKLCIKGEFKSVFAKPIRRNESEQVSRKLAARVEALIF